MPNGTVPLAWTVGTKLLLRMRNRSSPPILWRPGTMRHWLDTRPATTCHRQHRWLLYHKHRTNTTQTIALNVHMKLTRHSNTRPQKQFSAISKHNILPFEPSDPIAVKIILILQCIAVSGWMPWCVMRYIRMGDLLVFSAVCFTNKQHEPINSYEKRLDCPKPTETHIPTWKKALLKCAQQSYIRTSSKNVTQLNLTPLWETHTREHFLSLIWEVSHKQGTMFPLTDELLVWRRHAMTKIGTEECRMFFHHNL